MRIKKMNLFSFFPRGIKMSNEEWIKFEDEMPKLNQRVRLKFKNGSTYEAKLIISEDSLNFLVFMGNVNVKQIVGWQHIKVKGPDFNKLKDKDFISFIINDGTVNVEGTGYYHDYDDDVMHVYRLKNGYSPNSFKKANIKKIIRIDLEENTFEEI
jgi:hypothetical protein